LAIGAGALFGREQPVVCLGRLVGDLVLAIISQPSCSGTEYFNFFLFCPYYLS
jgi:hypothetical protein